jgi:flagellar basal body-associated protein FliL
MYRLIYQTVNKHYSKKLKTKNMKKFSISRITVLMLAISAVAFTSCKKKKDDTPKPVVKEVSLIENAFANAAFTTTATGSGSWEYGVKFSISNAGKITKLGSKMPEVGSYRVTLWDADSKAILAQATINQTTAGNLSFADIAPFAIIVGKDYYVTVQSINKKWFEVRKSGGGNITYPMVSGSMTIKQYGYKSSADGAAAAFPTVFPTDYYAGFTDIEFVQD